MSTSEKFTIWSADHPFLVGLLFTLVIGIVHGVVIAIQGAPLWGALTHTLWEWTPEGIFFATMAKMWGPRWKERVLR
jgi:hypothetical protein